MDCRHRRLRPKTGKFQPFTKLWGYSPKQEQWFYGSHETLACLSLQLGACRRSSAPTPPLICALALLRCAECWHFSRGENPREPS